MDAKPPKGEMLGNFDVVQRMVEAWNPPDVSGIVSVTEGAHPGALHLCFQCVRNGRCLTVFSVPIERRLFRDPEYRRELAQNIRSFLVSIFDREEGSDLMLPR